MQIAPSNTSGIWSSDRFWKMTRNGTTGSLFQELVQDPETERRIIRACLDAGGWEMRYCTSRFIVDGAEGESSMAIVQLLRDMVRQNIAPPDRGLSHGKMKEAAQ